MLLVSDDIAPLEYLLLYPTAYHRPTEKQDSPNGIYQQLLDVSRAIVQGA